MFRTGTRRAHAISSSARRRASGREPEPHEMEERAAHGGRNVPALSPDRSRLQCDDQIGAEQKAQDLREPRAFNARDRHGLAERNAVRERRYIREDVGRQILDFDEFAAYTAPALFWTARLPQAGASPHN